jgi:hypothetical protein
VGNDHSQGAWRHALTATTTTTTSEELADHIRPEVSDTQPALAEPQAHVRN